ncbi:hypothetical protein QZH41_012913, partial [Actinostola sp. cb2023]
MVLASRDQATEEKGKDHDVPDIFPNSPREDIASLRKVIGDRRLIATIFVISRLVVRRHFIDSETLELRTSSMLFDVLFYS